MRLSDIAKFLLGFVIAIAILVGSGVAVALYFITKLTALPPKPIFANEKPVAKPKPAPVASKPKPAPTAQAPATQAIQAVAAQSAPTPTPNETPSPAPLEPGAYRARVTWSRGLSIRSSPNLDSERVGGVGYNERVVVLSESNDKRWLKVRLENSNSEGWVKAGNLERVE